MIFTSTEHVDFGASFAIRHKDQSLERFEYNTLFISIYESCKHRKHPVTDATELTQTILSKLLAGKSESVKIGEIKTSQIIETALETLKRFDAAAATIYAAYH
jgi:transcriptional regulator NrdR family protein